MHVGVKDGAGATAGFAATGSPSALTEAPGNTFATDVVRAPEETAAACAVFAASIAVGSVRLTFTTALIATTGALAVMAVVEVWNPAAVRIEASSDAEARRAPASRTAVSEAGRPVTARRGD